MIVAQSAAQTPVLTRYRGSDYSEMTLVTASKARPCVICREPIPRASRYLFAVVRVSKVVTRRSVCHQCALKKPGSELHTAWNRLLTQGDC